jgi:esterase/lipase superfamily enzyme
MDEILNFLSIVGVSAIISTTISFILDIIKQKTTLRNENLFNEKKEQYTSILVFMSIILDVDNYYHVSTKHIPNNEDEKEIVEYYKKELVICRNRCYLFANQNVIEDLNKFISYPSEQAFQKVAISMRKDLWKKRIKVDYK